MRTIASYLDMRSSKGTHEQIIRLADYISGQLNEKTLLFLHEVCSQNAVALEKIITKCTQLKIQLKAKEIDKIIALLEQQHSLPQDILNSLQYFLMDKRVNKLAQVLISSVNNLDASLTNFDSFKSTIHVINQFNIYIHSGLEKQFLNAMVTMMIRFYTDEHPKSSSHTRQRSIEDTTKWMKSLLSISEKSDLSKLIDLLGDRLHLIGVSLPGQIRKMELIELYCLFEDLAMQTKHFVPHDSNKSLLLDIHAMMLLALVSKKCPYAFFDIAYAQQAEPTSGILDLIQSQLSKPLMLDTFFESEHFKTYFRECSIRTNSNQQVFLSIFIQWTQAIIQKEYEHTDTSRQALVNFFESAYRMRLKMENVAFLKWFSHEIASRHLQDVLFIALEQEANLLNTQSGSLIFVTNKLVSMGFSPKAISATQTGSFQPLITSNVLQISKKNLQTLKDFFNQLNQTQQHQLITEFCLVALMPYQMHTGNLSQSKTKPLQRRIADQHYPIPALHRIQKAKQARPARLVRKQPPATSYSMDFELLPDKIKPMKHPTKYATRH